MNNKEDDDLYLDALVDDVDEDNEYFQFTEIERGENPMEGDCVVKAISQATKQSYEKVLTDLKDLEEKMKQDFRYHAVYSKYLKRHGWKESDILLKPYASDLGKYGLYTVGQFCEIYKHRDMFQPEFVKEIPTYDELIINCYDEADENGERIEGTPGHMTYVKNGVVHDDRDCYNYYMYDYWYKK